VHIINELYLLVVKKVKNNEIKHVLINSRGGSSNEPHCACVIERFAYIIIRKVFPNVIDLGVSCSMFRLFYNLNCLKVTQKVILHRKWIDI